MSQLTELQSDNIAQLMETSRRQLNPERQFTSPTLKCSLPLLLEGRLCGGYGVAMPVNELMVTRVTLDATLDQMHHAIDKKQKLTDYFNTLTTLYILSIIAMNTDNQTSEHHDKEQEALNRLAKSSWGGGKRN